MAGNITEVGGLGAAITPERWAAFVLDHLAHESVLLASGARRVLTDAKQIHVPRITNDGGTGWYSELEEIAPSAPEGDDLVLTPRKCAALAVLSNESVDDSDPDVLDGAGAAMVRAVAGEVDRACFAGAGAKQPVGILTLDLTDVTGAVDYPNIVRAAGTVRGAGGRPNALYINPADLTELQLATDADDRPLISGDPTQGAPPVIAGLQVWPTPAVPADTALVAQADQIVVAVRRDASVEISRDAKFTADGTVARVIARVDVGINDDAGLARIAAA